MGMMANTLAKTSERLKAHRFFKDTMIFSGSYEHVSQILPIKQRLLSTLSAAKEGVQCINRLILKRSVCVN